MRCSFPWRISPSPPPPARRNIHISPKGRANGVQFLTYGVKITVIHGEVTPHSSWDIYIYCGNVDYTFRPLPSRTEHVAIGRQYFQIIILVFSIYNIYPAPKSHELLLTPLRQGSELSVICITQLGKSSIASYGGF